MTVHLGIDLGTSSVKCALLADDGALVATSQVAYPIDRPHPGWAEQDPAAWWAATSRAIRDVLAQRPGQQPSSVGLSGQMHGVVLLDAAGRPVRPAIVWPDARTGDEVAHWRDAVGDRFVATTCGMPIAAGLAGISLSWLSKHEPDALARTASILQPKDWVRYCLTGVLAVEPTDACASLLFSIEGELPVPALLQLAGVAHDQLPSMVPTLSVAGVVTSSASEETGLAAGTPVAAGGGDQAMAGIALGLGRPDRAAISISSGATALVPLDADERAVEQQSLTHHVIAGARPGSRVAMGVVLAAGLATRWLAEEVVQGAASEASLLEAADSIAPGADGLTASPHLGGLRTPVVDSRPQGAFIGLGFQHTPAHLMRAMVDGVALALTGSVRAIQSTRTPVEEIVLAGGGSRFSTWHRAIADASGLPVVLSSDLDHSSLGAALVGAMAVGHEVDFDARTRVAGRVEPDAERTAAYLEARALGEQRGQLPSPSQSSTPEVMSR